MICCKTVIGKRMKNGSGHVVALSADALEILREIPRGSSPFVFSSNGGNRPLSGFSKLKIKIDDTLPEKIAGWRFHDLRRTMRTGLSMLGVADRVAELTIAHSPPGLHKIYDQYSFLAEKLDAMTRWQDHLRVIRSPASGNILKFPRAS